MTDDHVDYVRRLWQTLERAGIDAMLALVPPDAVWEPLRAERALRGPDELRSHFAELDRTGRPQEATVSTFEAVGTAG